MATSGKSSSCALENGQIVTKKAKKGHNCSTFMMPVQVITKKMSFLSELLSLFSWSTKYVISRIIATISKILVDFEQPNEAVEFIG